MPEVPGVHVTNTEETNSKKQILNEGDRRHCEKGIQRKAQADRDQQF